MIPPPPSTHSLRPLRILPTPLSPMNLRTRLLASCLAAFGVASAFSLSASAEEPFAGQVPPAQPPDELSGHLLLAPRLQYLVPTGSAEKGWPQRGYTAAGIGFGFDAAYGVSEYVAIQARFDRASLPEGNTCPAAGTCSAQTTAVGLGVEYHLVNGAAFDPWFGAGVAWRWTSFDLSGPGLPAGKLDFSGLDWLHLAFGGEWYPHRLLGVGPYLAFDVGSYSSRPGSAAAPPGASSESAIHSFFSIGFRGVFSPMR